MLNPDTVVVAHGYSGDAAQIQSLLPYMRHHKTPVIIMSPTDSPITPKLLRGEGLIFQTAGLRAYVGPVSLERQRDQLRLLLQRPERFFLLNDSDSLCIAPKIPEYLYKEPDVVWSNVVSDEFHPRPEGYPFPRLAFQPPYFLSRTSIEKLVAVADSVPANPRTPFIDWCMMAWTVTAKLAFKAFPDGMSCGTGPENTLGRKCMTEGVGIHGKIFLHSVKTRDMIGQLAGQRIQYVRRNGLR